MQENPPEGQKTDVETSVEQETGTTKAEGEDGKDGGVLEHEGTPLQDESSEAMLQPMDLASPLDSDSDINFDEFEQSGASEVGKLKKKEEESAETMEEVEVKQKETTSGDQRNESEETDHQKTEGRVERLDSVQIDPSYQPDAEELLYEGDVENEPEAKTDGKMEGVTEESEKKEDFLMEEAKEEGFIVDLHDVSMEIDDHLKTHEEKRGKADKSDKEAPGSHPAEKDSTQQSSDQRRKETSDDVSRFVSLLLNFLSTGPPFSLAESHLDKSLALSFVVDSSEREQRSLKRMSQQFS